MAWSTDVLYARYSPALCARLQGVPALARQLYHLVDLPGVPLPPEGLLAVRELTAPDGIHGHGAEPWDVLRGPDVLPPWPPLDAWEAPPRAVLGGLQQLAEGDTLVFYRCQTWGGDIEREAAWILGPRPERLRWQSRGQVRRWRDDAVGEDVGGDVLMLALAHLGVAMTGPYFEPHTRGVDWEAHRVGPAPERAWRWRPEPEPASLYRCVQLGDVEGTRRHLDGGADPDAYGPPQPLHVVAKMGRADLVALLLAHGATALPFALREAGNAAVARLLLDAGAPMGGETVHAQALLHAARGGRADVVALLLERGAPVAPWTEPLFLAACEGGLQALAFAHLPDDPEQLNDGLEKAANGGHSALGLALLERGAAPTADVLAEACEGGAAALVTALLTSGLDPDARRHGRTPLYQAAQRGHLTVVDALLAADADPRAGSWHVPPINAAAGAGRVAVVRRLLDAGVGVHEGRQDRHRWSPLFEATWAAHQPVVDLLLARGADPEEVDTAGRRLRDIAAERGIKLSR
ncbi:MAG: ankyrin repeat domain-containing protein [Alphaproteobacteria bacterium]|nr:ankyrin repeat domain-containing protein [Alphaproteobacteria bacterium]